MVTYYMDKSTKNKPIEITADYIIDMYIEAKKQRGKKRKEAMEYVIFLSKNLNKVLHQDIE